jgi:dienelactone hydrolase
MRFEIDPVDGLADHGLIIRVLDAEPGSRITVSAETVDGDGQRWSSSNQFVADATGTVDLARDAPVQGSYFSMNPLGCITTMTSAHPDKTSIFATAGAAEMVVGLHAKTHGGATALATIKRRFQGPDVERHEVAAGAVHGTLFTRPGAAERPAVLLVPGVVPGDHAALPMGALLAEQGYVALVVDLTGAPGLPDALHEVPLEHLRAAIAWLGTQADVDAGRIGAVGFERGAEGLLAAASHLPDLGASAMVAVAPSCVAWQADDDHDASAWSIGGVGLPCGVVREGVGHRLLHKITGHDGVSHSLDAYRSALADVDLLRVAGFPVEAIAAPLLLLAGSDDRQWPSAEMADLIHRTRRSTHSNPADQMVVYDKAGRLLRAPYVPATGDRYVDPEGGGLLLGGHADEVRRSDVNAWAKITDFLARHLGHDVVPVPPLDGRTVDPEWPSGAVEPPPADPEDELARAIVQGIDLDLDGGSVVRNPLPPPPAPES